MCNAFPEILLVNETDVYFWLQDGWVDRLSKLVSENHTYQAIFLLLNLTNIAIASASTIQSDAERPPTVATFLASRVNTRE